MSTTKQARICLVTEELSFGRGAGGIGGAFHELALALTNAGHLVDVVYLPVDVDTKPSDSLLSYYYDHGISIVDPLIEQFVWAPFSYEKRSYGLFRHLVGSQQTYDFIHFHDYKGLGFASLVAKSQRLGFSKTKLVVQAHGPTRWVLAANQHPFTHEDQLKIDFMERQSIARADVLVSPSRYLIDWFKQNGWALPAPNQIQVIQNVSLHLATLLNSERADGRNVPCREIILFGHEERKGIVPFCDALDLIGNVLATEDVTVTFLGRFGVINGWASPLYLVNRSHKWEFPIQFLPDLDRISACRYIANRKRGVVVVPSPSENSPYTVLESALAGRPLITSIDGGASELLESSLRPILTCKIDRGSLAAKLMDAVQKGLPPARLAILPNETVRLWLDLHATTAPPEIKLEIKKQRSDPIPSLTPKVVAAITHHERPGKLYDALMSLVAQTYSNLEIVVVDDGSRSSKTLHLLTRLAPLMTKLKVRLLRQENRYLGAARNHAAAQSDSDYILFLDDNDLAFPNLVQTLVTAAEATSLDFSYARGASGLRI